MKFLPLVDDELSLDILKSEYESATKFGPVSLGEKTIFYRKWFKCYYLSIDKIYRAFRRVKLIPTRIRSSNSEIQLDYLVLCSNKAELTEFALPDKTSVNNILNELQIKSPKIKIGKKEK